MAYYNYKQVYEQIPQRILDKHGDLGADYDGELWLAAAEYIGELSAERDTLKAAIEQAFKDGFYAYCPAGNGKVYEFSHDAIDEKIAEKVFRQWLADPSRAALAACVPPQETEK